MAFFGNLEGTLKSIFSLSKGTNKVEIRSNSGVLQGRNYGGAWTNLMGSSASYDVQPKSSSFSAVNGQTYICTGNMNVQLPSPTINTAIQVKSTGNYTLTIVRSGSENIEGVAFSFILDSELGSAIFIADGTDWHVI